MNAKNEINDLVRSMSKKAESPFDFVGNGPGLFVPGGVGGDDAAPFLGAGIGAIGLGTLSAIVGDRKKRIRNAVLGALAGGSVGLPQRAEIGPNDPIEIREA